MYALSLLLSLIIFSGPAVPSENFIEVEVKYLEQDYIQLFVISSDSAASFTEKQSYWRQVVNSPSHQIVRWNLRNVHYNKLRIDLTTLSDQLIEIKSILIHVNGKEIKLKGREILSFFRPNVFLELVSCNTNSIVFRSTSIDGYTDPSIVQINQSINSAFLNPNTKVSMQIKSATKAILAVKLMDANMVPYGCAICIDSLTKEITLPLFLNEKPKYISIQPSIANENEIVLKKITLNYLSNNITWKGKDIRNKFEYNLDYYKIDLLNDEYIVQNKIQGKFSTFEISYSNIEFPIDIFIRLGKGLLSFFISIVILFVFNKNMLYHKL